MSFIVFTHLIGFKICCAFHPSISWMYSQHVDLNVDLKLFGEICEQMQAIIACFEIKIGLCTSVHLRVNGRELVLGDAVNLDLNWFQEQ